MPDDSIDKSLLYEDLAGLVDMEDTHRIKAYINPRSPAEIIRDVLRMPKEKQQQLTLRIF